MHNSAFLLPARAVTSMSIDVIRSYDIFCLFIDPPTTPFLTEFLYDDQIGLLLVACSSKFILAKQLGFCIQFAWHPLMPLICTRAHFF